MKKKKLMTGWASALVGMMVFTLVAVPVLGHGGLGPRASVSVATVCKLEGSDFTVEIRVRDKTSGDAIPVVTGWDVQASFLERGDPGNNWQTLASVVNSGFQELVPEPPNFFFSRTFSLSAATGGIRSKLVDARTLNALVTIEYGKADGKGGVDDLRTINNRCSDDPETLDVVEPSGIKLTPEDIARIDFISY